MVLTVDDINGEIDLPSTGTALAFRTDSTNLGAALSVAHLLMGNVWNYPGKRWGSEKTAEADGECPSPDHGSSGVIMV